MSDVSDKSSGSNQDCQESGQGKPQHLDARTGESLSALMDGEVSEMELHRVLKVSAEGDARSAWLRYQMASASMRGHVASGPLIDLSSAIRDAIEEEDSHPRQRRGWLNTFSKLGLAASVAAVMVVSSQFVNQSGLLPGSGMAEEPLANNAGVSQSTTNTTPAALPAGFQAPSVNARVVSSQSQPLATDTSRAQLYVPLVRRDQRSVDSVPSLEVQQYLQRVMEVHAGHAALNSGRGMLPYARMPVAQDEQPR